jgi:ribosomal-protein-alanine N-acetyltransferase
MAKIIETDNLILRKFTVDDGEFIVRLLNSPGWLEFIGNRDIRTVEEAQIYLLTGPISSYEKLGFGLYLVELKKENEPIGMCGLIKRDGLENIDIGFAFLPDYSGKGYAYEASVATLTYAQSQLGIPKIVSITQENNTKAISLLKKLGFTYTKNVQLPYEDTDFLLFDTGPVPNAK